MKAGSNRLLLSGNHAVSYAVKLAKPNVMPVYPITPQTPILEKITEFHASGEMGVQGVPFVDITAQAGVRHRHQKVVLDKKLERIMPWTRGVDTTLFRPRQVRRFGSEAPVLKDRLG